MHMRSRCVLACYLNLAERGESFTPFSKALEKRPFSNVFNHFPVFRLLSGGEYRPS
jgi:hypothetical protein